MGGDIRLFVIRYTGRFVEMAAADVGVRVGVAVQRRCGKFLSCVRRERQRRRRQQSEERDASHVGQASAKGVL